MDFLYLITSILFFIWIIRNTLFWVSLWQLKEYRLDRMLVHLKETHQGKRLFFSPLSILKWSTFILYIAVILNHRLFFLEENFILFIFVIQSIFIASEFYNRTIKRPVPTLKAILIIFLTLFLVFLSFAVPLVEKFFWLVFLDRAVAFIIAFFVFVFYFPTELYRDWKIDRATKKLSQHKKIVVIGVSGSFGKSSTKEYIAQILDKKFNVLKTKGTNNTPIGIANTILSGLKKDTEIFVVEMGAYKRGEIKEMCQMTHPKIGVLTSVSEQHLSLFGSIQNTIKAKYELIDSLPKNGLAIFNGNNEITKRLYDGCDKKKILYECLNSKKAEVSAFNILAEKEKINFSVRLNNKIFHFEAPLIGEQNVNNILPAIYIANFLGMRMDEIKRAVLDLLPLPKTMILKKGPKNMTVVDDSFNASPDAVLAAINYMKIYSGKKFLVLQPMIELGSNAEDEHYKVTMLISKLCDYLFLTNKNFYEAILGGIKEGRGKCVVKVQKAKDIAEYIKRKASPNDIAVFEGKEAGIVLNKMTNS